MEREKRESEKERGRIAPSFRSNDATTADDPDQNNNNNKN